MALSQVGMSLVPPSGNQTEVVMRVVFICLLMSMVAPLSLLGQTDSVKVRFPIWTFHEDSVTTYGVSVGLASVDPKLVTTNGIKVELLGMGCLIPLIPGAPTPVSESELDSLKRHADSIVNGLELSLSGTFNQGIVTGISAGYIGQGHLQVNGLSVALIGNFAQEHNGLQLAASNWAGAMNGFQVGLINQCFGGKGIQIGLWNVNPDRSMPLINFHF